MTLTLLRKLRGRSVGELRDRTRQGLHTWLERYGMADAGEPDPSTYGTLFRSFDGPPLQGPFFSSLADRASTVTALSAVDAHAVARIGQRADLVIQGRHDVLGYHDLQVGTPVDWSFEPVARVRAPEIHWSRIDYLDPLVAGDHKVVWEIARQRSALTLAQAWWCTQDARYGEALSHATTHWLDTNPPKRGVHWASSLELAFRGITWTWVLALTADVLAPALQRRLLAHLVVSARHIERYLSRWFSPNTHLTGEALGLYVIGTAFPQCVDAARWRDLGESILLEWCPRHLRPDGTYVEQSTWYHRYTVDFYLHLLILSAASHRPAQPVVRHRLEHALDVLAWISGPDGRMPLIGDDDGGRLLYLDDRAAGDARTPLALGAVLFERDDFAHLAGTAPAELVWLLGPAGLEQYRRRQPRPPDASARAFTDGGVVVQRSGWTTDSSVLVVDAGPHGFLNSGHSHADALSIDLTVGGHLVFVDPGTFTYTTSPEWRNRFRQTASHTAATVDGCGSATPGGPFQWLSRVEARLDAWYEANGVALFAGSHDGFERLRPPVAYRRSIVALPGDIWIIRDEIRGEGTHELSVHFQCDPGLSARAEGRRVTLAREGHDLLVLDADVEESPWSIIPAWVSKAYGTREPAQHLRIVSRGEGAVSIATVVQRAGRERLSLATSAAPDGPVVLDSLSTPGRGMLVTEWTAAPEWLATDAKLAWCSEWDGKASIVAAEVSTIAIAGSPVLAGPVVRGTTVDLTTRLFR